MSSIPLIGILALFDGSPQACDWADMEIAAAAFELGSWLCWGIPPTLVSGPRPVPRAPYMGPM